MSATRRTPRGREAVREALLAAATELFAARGTAAVSIRDVAAHAGVNHGLVHRHFGAKERLVAAVMEQLRSQLQAELPGPDEEVALGSLLQAAWRATRRHRAWWQILARALLDGEDPRRLQASFPVIDRLRGAIARADPGPLRGLDPRLLTALVVAAGLGLLAFGPFVRAAVGLSDAAWRRYEDALPELLAATLVGGPPAAR